MIKISFLGDISLNDDYTKYYTKGLNPFSALTSILSHSNYVVGNLECMVKGEDGENLLKKPRLGTTEDTLNFLKDINLNVATLANNHIYDHLEDGFAKTKKFLNDSNIKFLGAGFTREEASRPLLLNENGSTIGLLNYATDDTNPCLPIDAQVFLNTFKMGKVIEHIHSLKGKVDHIVIILHWGGRVEGGLFPDFYQPYIAKCLIDSGADLIVGHHSHTVQPYEIYKNKLIAYSLGNFCFSDYIFDGVFTPLSRRRKISTILRLQFREKDYSFDFKFFENKDEFYKELPNYYLIMKLKNINFKLLFINKFLWNIYFFHKNYLLPIQLFLYRKDISFSKKIERFALAAKKRIK